MSFTYKRLDKNDAAVLFVDHQAGLLSLVRDFSPDEFKNNVLALADIARFFNLPTILTTSFEDGPNGPLVPELKEMFPQAPYIARPGNINAWDNEDFVKAVKATGKKQLIIAGVVTDVCVAFPTLSALEEGFDVFVVTDASGTFNPVVRDAAWARMTAAGAQLMNWFSVGCELHRDWRNDIEGFGAILGGHLPAYANLIQSFGTKKQAGFAAVPDTRHSDHRVPCVVFRPGVFIGTPLRRNPRFRHAPHAQEKPHGYPGRQRFPRHHPLSRDPRRRQPPVAERRAGLPRWRR